MPAAAPRALALLVAVAAVSWAAVFIRLCDAESPAIAFYRLLFASAALLPWGLRGARRVPARVWGAAFLAGALLAVHFAAWIASLFYTSVASSVTLVATQPVFAVLLAPLLLGERAGRAGIAGVLLSLAGVAVLAGGDLAGGGSGGGPGGDRALLGDGLAVLGAASGAVYLTIGRRVRERIPFPAYLLAVNVSATVCLAGFAWLRGTPLSGFPRATWLWFVLLALVPHLFGHGLLNWSVRRFRAFAVALAVLGEPVLSTLYAAVIFGEIPRGTFYLGGLAIGAGVVLAMRDERAGAPL